MNHHVRCLLLYVGFRKWFPWAKHGKFISTRFYDFHRRLFSLEALLFLQIAVPDTMHSAEAQCPHNQRAKRIRDEIKTISSRTKGTGNEYHILIFYFENSMVEALVAVSLIAPDGHLLVVVVSVSAIIVLPAPANFLGAGVVIIGIGNAICCSSEVITISQFW